MRFPIPSFVPVPGPEVLRVISIVSFLAGLSLMAAGLLLLFRGLGRGKNGQRALTWTLLGAGALLSINHGLLLIF